MIGQTILHYRIVEKLDGTHLAIFLADIGRIYVRSFRDGSTREFQVKGWSAIGSLYWTADSKGFFATAHAQNIAVVLHVDLQGNATILWKKRGNTEMSALPSPDGQRLSSSPELRLGLDHRIGLSPHRQAALCEIPRGTVRSCLPRLTPFARRARADFWRGLVVRRGRLLGCFHVGCASGESL